VPRRPTLDQVAVRAGVGRGTVSRVINGSPQVYEREGGRRARRRGARLRAEPGRAGSRRRRARGRRAPRTRRSRARSPRSVGSPESAASVPRRPQPAARLVLISAQDDGPSSALAGYLSLQDVDGALLLSLHGDDQLSRMLRDAMSQWFWAGPPSAGPASGTSTLTTPRALFHSATVWADCITKGWNPEPGLGFGGWMRVRWPSLCSHGGAKNGSPSDPSQGFA
jgi:hypothetical protein